MGEEALIAGFSVAGSGRKAVLLRAVGPGLTPFGVSGALRDPRLVVGRSATRTGAGGWKTIEKLCGFGPFQRQLPEAIREEAVRATVEASGFSVWLQEMELVEGLSEEQAEVLAEA